jgi:hypothetical protein
MADILSPTGIEKPLGAELHSRALINRNYDRTNQIAIDSNKQANGVMLDKDHAAAANGITTIYVFDALASFTFKAGRKYRIRWEFTYSMSALSNVFYFKIQSCNPADADNVTTGLTQLSARPAIVVAAGSPEFFGFEAYYKPVADTTVKIKFTVERSVGGGTLSIAADPAYMYIEDIGAQF